MRDPAAEFAKWPWQRCHARCEDGSRCDLVKNHRGDHALELGMDTPTWSTRWTS